MAAVDSMLMFPPNLYIDIFTRVMGFGGEQVTRVGPLRTRPVPLEEEARHLLPVPALCRRRTQQPGRLRTRKSICPHQTLICPHPVGISVCCLRHPVHGGL